MQGKGNRLSYKKFKYFMTSLFTKYKNEKAIAYFIGVTDEIITFLVKNPKFKPSKDFRN